MANNRETTPTVVPGIIANDDSDLVPIRVNHAVIGLAGEVGELASLVQKRIYYGKDNPGFKQLMFEELSDVLWYVAECLNALGLDMTECMEANIKKLQIRYPERYEDIRAADENRDKVAELRAVSDSMGLTCSEKYHDGQEGVE